MKETEVHCDHIPALGGMAVVCHIPYNVPAKVYHKERNPPMIGHCDQFRFFRLHKFPGLHNPSSHTICLRFCPQSRILVGTNPLALINRAFHAITELEREHAKDFQVASEPITVGVLMTLNSHNLDKSRIMANFPCSNRRPSSSRQDN